MEKENTETTVDAEVANDTSAPAADTTVTEKAEPAAELSLREKVEAMADKVREEQKTPEQKAEEKTAADKASSEKDDETKTPEEKAAAESAKPVVTAFTPNAKIKVMDKEHEIPKEFQALMKDKESEKSVRELFEKAHGLPIVKARLEQERAEKADVAKERDSYKTAINGAAEIYNNVVKTNDFLKLDAFWKKIGVDKNVVMQYALAQAKYSEMQPNERAVIDSRIQAEQQAEELRQQNNGQLSETQQLKAQMKSFMLDTRLASPEISALTQSFDTQVGRPGAFADEVIREGRLAWSTEQKDLTPDEAIQAVIKRYNIKATAPASATENAPAATAAAPVTTPVVPKPAPGTKVIVQRTANTMPNLQGNSASPLKAKPKSVDDLRAAYKQKLAEAAG